MRLIRYLAVSWALNVLVLGVVTVAFSDVTSKNFGDLVVAGLVFGILNTIVKPLLKLLTLPLAVITLGIAWFFVAMLMLWITSAIVSGWAIHGFWTYVWATFLVWGCNVVLEVVERRTTK